MQTYERSFALEVCEISRAYKDGRTVEAYAAVFDQPQEIHDQHGHYTEVISRNAFSKTLNERGVSRVRCLYNHGLDAYGKPDTLASVPIGTPLEIKADNKGLMTITRYNNSALADSVLEAIKGGSITNQSFRGAIYKSTKGARGRNGLPTITRTELGLTEYGPNLNGAYLGAEIVAVRTLDQITEDVQNLEADELLGLLRSLESTLATKPGSASSTSNLEAGTEEPHSHSARQRLLGLRTRMRELGV